MRACKPARRAKSFAAAGLAMRSSLAIACRSSRPSAFNCPRVSPRIPIVAMELRVLDELPPNQPPNVFDKTPPRTFLRGAIEAAVVCTRPGSVSLTLPRGAQPTIFCGSWVRSSSHKPRRFRMSNCVPLFHCECPSMRRFGTLRSVSRRSAIAAPRVGRSAPERRVCEADLADVDLDLDALVAGAAAAFCCFSFFLRRSSF